MAGRVEHDQVGPLARREHADVVPVERRGAAGVAACTASAGVIPISRTASAMQSGIELV